MIAALVAGIVVLAFNDPFAQSHGVVEETPDISMAVHEVNLGAVPAPAHDA